MKTGITINLYIVISLYTMIVLANIKIVFMHYTVGAAVVPQFQPGAAPEKLEGQNFPIPVA